MKRCWFRAAGLCALTAAFACVLIVSFTGAAEAQTPEIRAYWVDAFHSGFKSATQVNQLLSDVRASNCNAVVVQMRRRGDTYYPSPYEPWASDADQSFDALGYLIQQAHGGSPRVEVHAWLCTLPVSLSSTPTDENHPYNKYRHFLTRSNSGATFDGSNYSFDPGHPEALNYITELYLDVVRRYDVDGIHFDYVRFAGNDGANNKAWGYNEVSVARFNARYGRTGQPLYSDELWKQWRRDQVSALVRKVYANTIAIKPHVKVSAATVTWGSGPTTEEGWYSTSAYSSVFQDWRSWMEEGILDINMPMTYYREYEYPTWYDRWIAYSKGHKYDRHCAIGPGVYLNSITDTISQLREIRLPGMYDGMADGMCFYSYAVTNNESKPFSEFRRALTQPSEYDSNPTPIFNTPVSVPVMPWKTSPTKGHIKGTITNCGAWLDGTVVTLTGPNGRSMRTDGTGFYAFIDLPPGSYTVSATHAAQTEQRPVTVTAGQVSSVDIDICVVDPTPPVISNVQVAAVDHNGARITWTTDDPSTSQVFYGLTSSYGSSTAEDINLVTSHSVWVPGLQPDTTYHFKVMSANAVGLTSHSGDYTFTTAPPPFEFVIDNIDPEVTINGVWNTGTYLGGWPTSNSYYHWVYNRKTSGTAAFTWRPNILRSGRYDVYCWYNQGTNRTANAVYTVHYAGGNTSTSVNQQQNGSKWSLIASDVPFAVGTSGYVYLDNKTGENNDTKVIIADAIRFVYTGDPEPPTVPQNLQATAISASSIGLAWSASTDNVGVTGYRIYRGGEWTGGSATTSYIDSGLTANTRYTYTVSALDAQGNESAQSGAVSRYSLSAPPTAQSVTCGRSTDQWYNTPPFVFSNGGFGPGKVDYYSYAWNNASAHTWINTETIWASGTATVSATSTSQPWYFHVRGFNADNIPNGTLSLGPYYFDGEAPVMGPVTSPWYLAVRGGAFEGLTAQWTAQDGQSGIEGYQYAIGTTLGAADILGWTSCGTATSASHHYAGAALGQAYYWSVKAGDRAGNWSAAVSASPCVYANACDTLAEAMNNPDSTPVVIDQAKVVSGVFSGFYFVQEPSRIRGLRVNTSVAHDPGTRMNLAGRLATVDGERQLSDIEVKGIASGAAPIPLAVRIASIGGASPDPYTPGIAGMGGAYNLGLLVRVAGMATEKGAGFFVLSDGSGATAKVYCAAVPPDNAFVGVTGIATVEAGARVIRTRGPEDVRVF